MKALDTNVLVRCFVDDADDEQAAGQRTLLFIALNTALVGLSEEWMFRGVRLQGLRSRLARAAALQFGRQLPKPGARLWCPRATAIEPACLLLCRAPIPQRLLE